VRVVLWVITLLRVALIPVFVTLGLRAQALARAGDDPGPAQVWVIAVLVVMGASDLADGWIARRFGLATQVGAVVDAVADKLVQVTLVTFFSLSQGPAYAALPLWLLAVLVGRDVVLGGGMLLARARSVPLRVVHRPHGRWTSVLVFVILAWLSFGLPHAAVPYLSGLAAAVVTISGSLYLADGIAQARVVLRGRR